MDFNKFKENINNTTIFRAKQDISLASSFINKYKNDHPTSSLKEIIELFENDIVNDSNNNYNRYVQEVSGIPCQILAINHLQSNEKILKQIYSTYKNKEELTYSNKELFSYDLTKSSNLLIKSLLIIYREKMTKPKHSLSKDAEYNFLKNAIKNLSNPLEQKYKEDNIKLLLFVKNFFSENNLLENFINDYNAQLSSLWLEDLSYTLDYSEEKPKDLGVNKILSEENLSKMSSQQLTVLNMFWQNKYAKKLSNINIGAFIIQQMDINNIKKVPNDSIINNLLIKYTFLQDSTRKMLDSSFSDNDIEINLKKLSKRQGYEYEKYFTDALPYMKHDLYTDFKQCLKLNKRIQYIYAVKNNLAINTIANLSDNKKIKNWGFINDSTDNYNTIQNKSRFILICIDYPGLNRPVKIHVEREFLADSLLNAKSTNLIPIYEGKTDYESNFTHLTTPLVLPFEKSHRDFLKNVNLNKETHTTPLLRHTVFLANPDKFPEHLKVTDSNGNKVRKKKYIDLFSGRIFIEDGKNIVPESKTFFSDLDEI